MSFTRKIVDTWISNIKKDLLKRYNKLGYKASGDWGKSLSEDVSFKSDKVMVSMEANKYSEQMEFGRSKNKNQNQEALRKFVGWAGSTVIADWVKNKGLNLNPYAVAYSIAVNGWKAKKDSKGGLVSGAVTQDKVDELNRSLTLGYIDDFKSEILKNITVK